jgi:CRP-like cAMP-binding protein
VLRRDAKVQLLGRVPLFAHCSKKELRRIATLADEIDLPEGKELTREGRTGREFFVLLEGSADVRRKGRKIRALGKGDFLGEIALISEAPRTATVTTSAPTRLLVLTDRAFERVTGTMPSIRASVLKALSQRLQADAL